VNFPASLINFMEKLLVFNFRDLPQRTVSEIIANVGSYVSVEHFLGFL